MIDGKKKQIEIYENYGFNNLDKVDDKGRKVLFEYKDMTGKEVNITGQMLQFIMETVGTDLRGENDLFLFAQKCEQMQVHPLSKQIYPILMMGKLQFVVAIEFMRARASKTGEFGGLDQTRVYKIEDKLIQVKSNEPTPLNVSENEHLLLYSIIGTMKRNGITHTVETTMKAHGKCGQTNQYGKSKYPIWDKMPVLMLKKTNAAQLYREMFSDVMGGVYEQSEDFREPEVKVSENLPEQDASLVESCQKLAVGMRTAETTKLLSDMFSKTSLRKLDNGELEKLKQHLETLQKPVDETPSKEDLASDDIEGQGNMLDNEKEF